MVKKKKKDISFSTKLWVSIGILICLFFLSSIMALIIAIGDSTSSLGANTALIRVVGPVTGESTSGVFSSSSVGSSDIVNLLEEATEDDSIKAVLIEINSPGGSAVASDEIGQAIKKVRESKPVVAWIREIGASGGYWVASSTDHIVANRMSITGSIGVYGSYLGFEEFMDDWNITNNRLVAGDKKDVGSPFVALGREDRVYLQTKLDKIHGFFIKEIAENRNMSYSEVEQLADGSFMLGIEAYDAGLIDELGGEDEAIAWIESQINDTVSITEFETERGFFEELFGAETRSEFPLEVNSFVPELR